MEYSPVYIYSQLVDFRNTYQMYTIDLSDDTQHIAFLNRSFTVSNVLELWIVAWQTVVYTSIKHF